MDQISSHLAGRPVEMPAIQTITLDHPWQWIAAGWSDLKRAPGISLAYGVLFFVASLACVSMALSLGFVHFIPALLAGFFLLSPVFAYGLIDISRRLATGEPVRLRQVVMAWRGNAYNIVTLGLMLLMAFLVWMMLANMVFAIFYFGITPTLDNVVQVLFLSGESPAFVAAGMVLGGVVAFAVFCITAVSVPMMVDGKTDVFSAVITSLRCVSQNPRPMLLWAALIVMLVGIGMVTLLLGLIVTMPLIGLASWHAYADLARN